MQPTGRFAGRLRYDTLANGCTRILPTWLIATSDRHVAARIATLLAGEPYVEDGDGDGQGSSSHVLTDHAEIDVLLDGPQAIRLRMLGRHGATVLRNCNGRTQRTPSGTQPCQCPPTLKDRWKAAKAGHGCEPLVHVALRLAADPTLGQFLLSSATWTFADHAITVRAALRRQRDKPVRARLAIDRALHTTSSGTTFAYSRPTITILPTRP
jgi:hypothetical protein